MDDNQGERKDTHTSDGTIDILCPFVISPIVSSYILTSCGNFKYPCNIIHLLQQCNISLVICWFMYIYVCAHGCNSTTMRYDCKLKRATVVAPSVCVGELCRYGFSSQQCVTSWKGESTGSYTKIMFVLFPLISNDQAYQTPVLVSLCDSRIVKKTVVYSVASAIRSFYISHLIASSK